MQFINELTFGIDENDMMRNRTSRELYEYWNRVRQSRFAPWRSEIEPADIHTLLPDVFIVEMIDRMTYRFRLAGTRMCSTYRRELKGQDFLSMWSDPDREGFETVLHNVARDGAVGLVSITGTSSRGQENRFEMVMMPLRHHDGEISRFIGALSPAETPYWLGSNPIVSQKADTVRLMWPDEQPAFMRRAVNEDVAAPFEPSRGQPIRRKGHLSLYMGGRTD